MTEVAQLEQFGRHETERTRLHLDRICEESIGQVDESVTSSKNKMHEKINFISSSMPLIKGRDDVPQGDGQAQDIERTSSDEGNIWKESEEEELHRVSDGRDSRSHEAPDDKLSASCVSGSSSANSDLEVLTLEQFVESEFQFLDSDDDEAEVVRSDDTERPPLSETLMAQTENSESESLPHQLTQPSLETPTTSEPSGQDEDALLIAEDYALSCADPPCPPPPPPPPCPPPLPPTGFLFTRNPQSGNDVIVHKPSSPEVVEDATDKKKPSTKNQPKPQDDLFMELQSKLNRRLQKIDEDIERNREAEKTTARVDDTVREASRNSHKIATVPTFATKVAEEDHHSDFSKHITNSSFSTEIETLEDNQLDVFSQGVGSTEEIEVTEGIKASTGDFVNTAEEVDSSRNIFIDSTSAEPATYEDLEVVLPDVVENNHCAETVAIVMSENSDSGVDVQDSEGVVNDLLIVPKETETSDIQSTTSMHQQETQEFLLPAGEEDSETIRASLFQPNTDAIEENPVPLLDDMPLTYASSAGFEPPLMLSDDHLVLFSREGPRTELGTPDSGADWTPQMDLMDDEFEDDIPREVIGRGIHLQRREDVVRRKTSKLYKKKQLQAPQRLPHEGGAFSLARINRAVKRMFGSMSGKHVKRRTPVSENVFRQEDGWEIYPAGSYDQGHQSESVQVVSVEMRPAYAYNGITRELILLPDHDKILVTGDGRRIREQDLKLNRKDVIPDSHQGSNGHGKRDKPSYSSKSKNRQPPKLNTKTVRLIHMHGGNDSVEDDSESDDISNRRNSFPAVVGGSMSANPNSPKRKNFNFNLSQILFSKKTSKSTERGKKDGGQLSGSVQELQKSEITKTERETTPLFQATNGRTRLATPRQEAAAAAVQLKPERPLIRPSQGMTKFRNGGPLHNEKQNNKPTGREKSTK